MSYQREPTLAQVNKSRLISRKGTMVFTGCSNYITNKLNTVGEAYTIYNCAPIEKYELKERVEMDSPLMFLGRIEEIKGAHIAVEVAKKSKRKLIIAGNIPVGKEQYFNEMIKPHLDDQIIYVGPVNDAQKNELLGKSTALLMPILWNEPFGIVMAESMACGTPVLGFNMGSVPEIVINGVNGFICKNIEEMVSHVAECNLLDRKEIRSITERKFSNEKIVSDYINLYQRLIERKNH